MKYNIIKYNITDNVWLLSIKYIQRMFNLIYIYFRKLKTLCALLLKMFLLINENYKLYILLSHILRVFMCWYFSQIDKLFAIPENRTFRCFSILR